MLKKLEGIGLNMSEARMYLANLEEGSAPASAIAKRAGMNRVTAYTILKRLLVRGIVSSRQQNGMQFFQALSPEILGEDRAHKVESFRQAIPFLQSLSAGSGMRPQVEFFEGVKSVKKSYLATLQSKTEILNYANSRNIREHWREYDNEYVQRRAEKKIFLRGLSPDDVAGRRVQGRDEEFYREIRLLSGKYFEVENEINIFDNVVLIASFSPVCFAIMIESQTVADTQRQIFEIAWEAAKMR